MITSHSGGDGELEVLGLLDVLAGEVSRVEGSRAVSYTHLRAHETDSYLVCRLLLEKKKYAVFCLKKKNSFFFFFFLMIRRQPRSTHCISSAASDVYKRQEGLKQPPGDPSLGTLSDPLHLTSVDTDCTFLGSPLTLGGEHCALWANFWNLFTEIALCLFSSRFLSMVPHLPGLSFCLCHSYLY